MLCIRFQEYFYSVIKHAHVHSNAQVFKLELILNDFNIIFICAILIKYFFSHGSAAIVGLCLLIDEVSRLYTDTTHSVGHLCTRVRPFAESSTFVNTQSSKETNIHAHDRIRTCSPRTRASTDPHLRPRGRWDRSLFKH